MVWVNGLELAFAPWDARRFKSFLDTKMVWVNGLEPSASASRTLRATNCATPRINLFYHKNREITDTRTRRTDV